MVFFLPRRCHKQKRTKKSYSNRFLCTIKATNSVCSAQKKRIQGISTYFPHSLATIEIKKLCMYESFIILHRWYRVQQKSSFISWLLLLHEKYKNCTFFWTKFSFAHILSPVKHFHLKKKIFRIVSRGILFFRRKEEIIIFLLFFISVDCRVEQNRNILLVVLDARVSPNSCEKSIKRICSAIA